MLNLKEAIPSKQRMEALATHIFRRIINFHRDKSGEILGRCCVRCVWEGGFAWKGETWNSSEIVDPTRWAPTSYKL